MKCPVPIYAQLIQECRKAVLLSRYRPGDLLPSIRQLGIDLAINPNTVVRAYQLLESQGILSGRKGLGYFVTEKAPFLCRREAGQAGLSQLAELVERLISDGVGETEILMSVKRTMKESKSSLRDDERHIG